MKKLSSHNLVPEGPSLYWREAVSGFIRSCSPAPVRVEITSRLRAELYFDDPADFAHVCAELNEQHCSFSVRCTLDVFCIAVRCRPSTFQDWRIV